MKDYQKRWEKPTAVIPTACSGKLTMRTAWKWAFPETGYRPTINSYMYGATQCNRGRIEELVGTETELAKQVIASEGCRFKICERLSSSGYGILMRTCSKHSSVSRIIRTTLSRQFAGQCTGVDRLYALVF